MIGGTPLNNDVFSANFTKVRVAVDDLLASGHSALALFPQLQARVLAEGKLSDEQKAKVCLKVAQADKCLADGADEALQLMSVASFASQVCCAC